MRVEAVLRELRYATRMLRKAPGSSFLAAFALALGMGLTTLMFSIVYGAMLRGLPFEDSRELVALRRIVPAQGAEWDVSIHDLEDWRAQQRSFEDLAGSYRGFINLSGMGETPEQLDGAFVTASMFRVLGARALLGRLFTEEDDRAGAPAVMLIGYRVWQQRFLGDPNVIGTAVRANGEPAVIVGVMPDGFGFPSSENAWMPSRIDAQSIPRGQGRWFRVLGRLRDGVSLEQARAEMDASHASTPRRTRE
jgi:putative ABC transport system permease protein